MRCKSFRPARPLILAAMALTLAVPAAHAHRFWLLPSSTVLSGDGDWVTVDAARGNDMFHFNHNAMGLNGLQITTPDGGAGEAVNQHTGEIRSVFDVKVDEAGTWKIAVVDDGVFARYEVDGDGRRWFGTDATFDAGVPANAQNLRVSERINRAETFVTAGAPTEAVLTPTGRGLELAPDTHPNDLYAGEAASFRLLVDGAPATDVKVTVVPGSSRYRNAPETITRTTDADGRFSVTWPRAGLFYLEASISDDNTSSDHAAKRRLTYVATFEVLPL